jgi:formate dehydrogenase maturation protein FdhE
MAMIIDLEWTNWRVRCDLCAAEAEDGSIGWLNTAYDQDIVAFDACPDCAGRTKCVRDYADRRTWWDTN